MTTTYTLSISRQEEHGPESVPLGREPHNSIDAALGYLRALNLRPGHIASIHEHKDGVAVRWHGVNMQTLGIGASGDIPRTEASQ